MIERLKLFLKLCRQSFNLLRRAEPLILSSSTAFFTTFAISPIVIILVSLFSLYFKSDRIKNQLFEKIASTVGEEATKEIETIVNNFMRAESNRLISIAGLIFFIFVGTTLLKVIKENIHKLWKIRRRRTSFRYQLRERGTSLGIIVLTGFLFLLAGVIDYSLAISLDYLQIAIPKIGLFVIRGFNIFFSVMVISTWFTILFKFLPEAKVRWEVAFNGGFITGILFNAGKLVLGKVLIHARIETIFGASASFALLLLFIFYCSFILYFGAAFTHAYGDNMNKHICATKYTHEYEEKLLD
ncbi:YihY/virulence factor BrkB family protein [Chryseosolibacter indicus]|uniref:YihY/virulence factor BrkB family protein n=1 Tax=Chryseosolibacter indicus TaxID=2782351 RepID=A0ABS5VKE7_9BACT|nr:YihY/virulence factor BrkB family protein [Chryseosolibacter indicus]MBT1701920.1 YihY/virulence factor BrkB family protein [Chryseosolibacter indicus]